ncbi:MAG: NTP transferase domain-containing protein [Nitriliruptorales bacterium]|nr:NTP transferase domain-containing protein [Nitriliruptorales bacterium]
MPPNVVILAAGLGSRLAKPFPKPLTPLHGTGTSIMQQQIDHLGAVFPGITPCVVVGFKKDLIMESFPNSLYVYNEDYADTNTSKSLLKALRMSPPGGVLWLNGDVVFERGVLELIRPLVEDDQSAVCVDHAAVGEEEVKYTVDEEGFIAELSKAVVDALGEAVGINFVSSTDKPALIDHLEACDDTDYFERGMELAITTDKMRFRPIDISAFGCVEVDFAADLHRAEGLF